MGLKRCSCPDGGDWLDGFHECQRCDGLPGNHPDVEPEATVEVQPIGLSGDGRVVLGLATSVVMPDPLEMILQVLAPSFDAGEFTLNRFDGAWYCRGKIQHVERNISSLTFSGLCIRAVQTRQKADRAAAQHALYPESDQVSCSLPSDNGDAIL